MQNKKIEKLSKEMNIDLKLIDDIPHSLDVIDMIKNDIKKNKISMPILAEKTGFKREQLYRMFNIKNKACNKTKMGNYKSCRWDTLRIILSVLNYEIIIKKVI